MRDVLGSRLTILRLSGLVGYDRLPGRFLANKKELPNGDAPVNIIHRDDCIGLITAVLEQNIWGEIINGSADNHPSRKDFYTKAAERIGLNPPTFKIQDSMQFKIICNKKGKALLNYNYIHPDPLKLI